MCVAFPLPEPEHETVNTIEAQTPSKAPRIERL
jgi:hypothetical protein